MTEQQRFKRGDVIVQSGNGMTSLGMILCSGPTSFDVIWLGGSTSRYRYGMRRSIRLATESDIASDPFAMGHIRREFTNAIEERRTGARMRRAGGP